MKKYNIQNYIRYKEDVKKSIKRRSGFEDNTMTFEIEGDMILNEFRQWQKKWDLYDTKQTLKKPQSSDDFIKELKKHYAFEKPKLTKNIYKDEQLTIPVVSNCDAIFEQDAKLTQEEIEEDYRNIPN